jgi:hypothetical protein
VVCICATCESHWKILDLSEPPDSAAQIREAYLDAVKVWHPDRFEGDARLRAKAEDRFKNLQVAYRELTEHIDKIAKFAEPTGPTDADSETRRAAVLTPLDAFAGDDRCYVSPHIPDTVRSLVAHGMGSKSASDLLVVIDLSGTRATRRDLSSFLALSTRHLTLKTPSAQGSLRYDDLDAARLMLIDHEKDGELGWWPRGRKAADWSPRRYTLEAFRRDGTHVLTLDTPVSDTVKQALFHFLRARTH